MNKELKKMNVLDSVKLLKIDFNRLYLTFATNIIMDRRTKGC